MTQNETNQIEQPSANSVQTILLRHSFVSLPIREDGTQIAIRSYNDQSGFYCDILAYRQINGTEKTFREEFVRLAHAVSELQTHFPDELLTLNSTFQSHSLSFLGKKVHVLHDETGHPVCSRIIPLLVCHTDDFLPSIRERATAYPIQVIHISQINQFLTDHISKQVYSPLSSKEMVQPLRDAYRNLGLTIILFPCLVGLTGILLSFELIPLALITILLSLLGPLALLKKATNSFKHFQVYNTIPIHTKAPIPTRTLPAQNNDSGTDLPAASKITTTTLSSNLPINSLTLANSTEIEMQSRSPQHDQKPKTKIINQ